MLKHLLETQTTPTRVVILGSKGFVGRYILRQFKLANVDVLGISKHEIDLLKSDAQAKLLTMLKPSDTLIIVSALAPCKNATLLIDNLSMIQTVCRVLEKIRLTHIIYISSDAIYSDEITLATERSSAAPSNLHGMMHSCRELILKQTVNNTPLAILRPSLLYGIDDPHNGYGPNRFRRLAEKNEKIVLFGNGEEKRDHVFIEDVAKIVSLVASYRSEGTLNIATGESHSFRKLAEEIVFAFESKSQIEATTRKNPITHRHFDISVCHQAFPTFRYTSFQLGLKLMLKQTAMEKSS